MNARRSTLTLIAALSLSSATLALAHAAASQTTAPISPAPAVASPSSGLNRYMVVRTFPAGALAGLDAAGEAAVNATNARYQVHWVYSYANPSKTKTFCIYEGPTKDAVQAAARANKLPVDEIVEIPNVLGAH